MTEHERDLVTDVLTEIARARGVLADIINPPRRWYHKFPPGSWWYSWWNGSW